MEEVIADIIIRNLNLPSVTASDESNILLEIASMRLLQMDLPKA
jgi:hypothetical protein